MKTLSEIYQPMDYDSRKLFRWHVNSKKYTTDDHERNDRGGHDRFGNDRRVYSGAVERSTKPPSRPPGSDEREYDLGRNTGVRQSKPGLSGTTIPQTQIRYVAPRDDDD